MNVEAELGRAWDEYANNHNRGRDMYEEIIRELAEERDAANARVDGHPHPAITAKNWNQYYPIGTRVVYWSFICDGDHRAEPFETVTRSIAWELCSGDPVVKIEGRNGGVHLSHLAAIPAISPSEGTLATYHAVPVGEPCPLADSPGGFIVYRGRVFIGTDDGWNEIGTWSDIEYEIEDVSEVVQPAKLVRAEGVGGEILGKRGL